MASNELSLRDASAVLALCIAATLAQSAWAQESGDSRLALEEIVVTAERRELNLQDVPISATVLTAEALAAQGVDNVIEIQQVAPSVAINTYNRSTFINIRGVGIGQSAPTSNPGVAYYVDGVFVPHEQFIAQSFFDIESIEVLRGPQGTLTGQNSTGGAIYVRTPAPSMDGFSGSIDQTIADYDWYRTVGAVNVPLSDTFALRVSGVYEERGSYTDNIGPSPSDPGSGEDRAVRAALRYQPTDGMTFDLRYEYFERETDYNAVKNRTDRVTADPFTIEEDALSFLNQDGYRASVEARIDLTPGLAVPCPDVLFRRRQRGSGGWRSHRDSAAGAAESADERCQHRGVPRACRPHEAIPGNLGQRSQPAVDRRRTVPVGGGAFYLDEESPVQVLRDNRNTTDVRSIKFDDRCEGVQQIRIGVRPDRLSVLRRLDARRRSALLR